MSSDKDLIYTFDFSVLTETLYAGALALPMPLCLMGM